ncbi:hypothetical protein [Halogeometricum limi]|uniref:VanZ like family protein n=1 Tax=Halogeometricum limi TaxID=555875 RepID=A0A1I6HJU3_9EURY|nr:hypothetical protein [Halogeometricum limi]SFR54743.1 hypothetical protein SAMN04488124_2326 [Halogeometricum limi]
MSLTPVTSGADATDIPHRWRFALLSVATRRALAAVTVLVATLGLLPLYESVWWWDILTHTLAGATITGWLVLSRVRVASVVFLVALCSGAWELLEYATPAFAFMAGSPADTVLDVACNFLGSAVVAGGYARFGPRVAPTHDDGDGDDRDGNDDADGNDVGDDADAESGVFRSGASETDPADG